MVESIGAKSLVWSCFSIVFRDAQTVTRSNPRQRHREPIERRCCRLEISLEFCRLEHFYLSYSMKNIKNSDCTGVDFFPIFSEPNL